MIRDLHDNTVLAHLRAERARSDGSGPPLHCWSRDNHGRGATAVEYALMVALIIGAIVALVATVGRQVFDMYNTVPNF